MSVNLELMERSARLIASSAKLKKQARILIQDGEALRKSSDDLQLERRRLQALARAQSEWIG